MQHVWRRDKNTGTPLDMLLQMQSSLSRTSPCAQKSFSQRTKDDPKLTKFQFFFADLAAMQMQRVCSTGQDNSHSLGSK